MHISGLKKGIRLRGRAFLHGMKLFCAGFSGDENVIGRYITVRENPDELCMEHPGKLYRGKVIYKISNIGNGFGFFAEFKATLLNLLFAEKYGFVPCVRYETSYLYYDEDITYTHNPFEYFFQPIGDDYSCENAMNMLRSRPAYCYSFEFEDDEYADGYHCTDKLNNSLTEVIKKYIRLRSDIESEFLEQYKALFGRNNRILGIHYRGTDFKVGYDNHPKNVEVNQVIFEAKKALEDYHFSRIFIATDDEEALVKLRGEFGEQVVFCEDTVRSDEKRSVAFLENGRFANHYKLGKEVLRDMFFLSRCDGLICGLSQVSYVARLFKTSRDESYSFLKIIDNGMNKNLKEFNH